MRHPCDTSWYDPSAVAELSKGRLHRVLLDGRSVCSSEKSFYRRLFESIISGPCSKQLPVKEEKKGFFRNALQGIVRKYGSCIADDVVVTLLRSKPAGPFSTDCVFPVDQE